MEGTLHSRLAFFMLFVLAVCCFHLSAESTRSSSCSLPQHRFRFDCIRRSIPRPQRPEHPTHPNLPSFNPFRTQNGASPTGRSQVSKHINSFPDQQSFQLRNQQPNFGTKTAPKSAATNSSPRFRQTAVAFQSPDFHHKATSLRRPVTRRRPNFRPTSPPARQSVTRRRPNFRPTPSPPRRPVTRRRPNFRPTPAPTRRPVTRARTPVRQAPAPVRQRVTRRRPNFRPTPAPTRQHVSRHRPNHHSTHAQADRNVERGRWLPLAGQRTNGAAIPGIRGELRRMIQRDSGRIADWVQLGFHTCVGGCDGCIDTTNTHNRGLITSYKELRDMQVRHSTNITLADLMALAAVEAGNEGLRASGNIHADIPYRIGRRTCTNPDAPSKLDIFPKGEDPDAIGVLMKEFRITRPEAVALLGAHSLGRCTGANSGFQGPWDNTPNKLDNAYYRSLVGTDWVTTLGPGGKVQWTSDRNDPSAARMMLTADMAILKKFTVSGSTSEPSCLDVKSCTEPSVDEPIVLRYSRDQDSFHEDFTRVYVKMLENFNGYLMNP